MTREQPQIEIVHDLSEAPGWIDMQRQYLAFAAAKHAEATGHHIDPKDQLRQTLAHIDACLGPDGRFIVARGGRGGLLGMVLLQRLASGKGEVKRLFVVPEARGLGVARLLMQAVTDAARAMGCTALYLDTSATLVEAIALYRSMGFVDAPFDDASVQDAEIARHLVILQKPL